MFAVIKTGGKQYRVEKGIYIKVEKLNLKPEEEVILNEVLLIGDENNANKIQVGTPYLENVEVIGKVVSQEKEKKIIAYKYKTNKGYSRKKGHRQQVTILKIMDIKIKE